MSPSDPSHNPSGSYLFFLVFQGKLCLTLSLTLKSVAWYSPFPPFLTLFSLFLFICMFSFPTFVSLDLPPCRPYLLSLSLLPVSRFFPSSLPPYLLLSICIFSSLSLASFPPFVSFHLPPFHPYLLLSFSLFSSLLLTLLPSFPPSLPFPSHIDICQPAYV